MQPFGNFKKKILNIGEAPGENEDKYGKPWQGKAGALLERTYKRLGIDLFEDCLNINAVHCRPMDKDGDNRAPSNFEVECCRKAVLQTIEEYKPRVIILLGNSAVFSLIGHRWKQDLGGITKWRGWTIPDQDFNTWICPTFHPSFVERLLSKNIGIDVETTIWEQDLKQAFELVKTPVPVYVEPEIEIIEDLSILNKITQKFAFDYETTGLKPHAPGHKIICCSVADTANHVYVFMMPQTKRERMPFLNLLTQPSIGKMAQNMKYEDTWTSVRLGVDVQNWVWDSMLASHMLDNRVGVTGLKFQTYVQFGVVDYASEVAPYLGAVDSKNANAINKIGQLLTKPGGIDMLLKYNALDSINEYRLCTKQMDLIEQSCLPF
jgi:DNA polymerase